MGRADWSMDLGFCTVAFQDTRRIHTTRFRGYLTDPLIPPHHSSPLWASKGGVTSKAEQSSSAMSIIALLKCPMRAAARSITGQVSQ